MLYFLLIFAVLAVLPLQFRILAYTGNNALNLQAEFMPLKLGKIKIFQSSITVKKVIASMFSGKKSKFSGAQIFNSVLKHIKIKNLQLKWDIGTGDAASTAIAGGQVFGLIAPFAANIAKKGRFNVDINPIFDKKEFYLAGECILKTNLVHTVSAMIEILRSKKNGKTPY